MIWLGVAGGAHSCSLAELHKVIPYEICTAAGGGIVLSPLRGLGGWRSATGVSLRSTACLWSITPSGFEFALPLGMPPVRRLDETSLPCIPLTPHLSPLTTHLSPLTTHLSPLTPHPSPLTSHHSPLTTHLSPLTSHHSPLTTNTCSNPESFSLSLFH